MSTFETIRIEKNEKGYAEVLFHRPEVRNALNRQMVNELTQALDQLAADSSVKGLLFHGAGGKAFVAGADISELLHRRAEDALLAINAGLFQKIEDFPWPVIAAISGFCLGGGCELALSCDIRIGSPSAVLGQPEVKLGIIPGAGAPHRLTRVVGTGLARELIFTGRLVLAEEAVRIGLLNRVVAEEELLTVARGMMEEILANDPLAVRLSKWALNAAVNSVDRRHQMLECAAQGMTFENPEKTRRMTAFLEQRKKKS
ncbi:MAG TPA: enoyl-CoA hydratase-related protein [Planctomycetota bacterium]|jgi:enoyl-CoA hydratase|nr:enoyl-CoA hydratase-related protein [Planctomycetota bacterium]